VVSAADGSVPRLSVVIPCRNEAALLPRQLEALAAQVYPGWWEVVVVDNGSTDGTASVARSFAGRVPALRVVGEPRPGRQHACNAGARAAEGDVILFVDGDDEVAGGYLSAMGGALAEYPFVAARLDYEALNPPWVRKSRRGAQRDGLQDWHYLPVAAGCSLGISRDLFLSCGGFDPELRYAEDVELCWRIQASGVELHFVPDAVVRYRYERALPRIYRQARGYGRGIGYLYRRFPSPVATPARKSGAGVRGLGGIARRVIRGGLGDRGLRARTVWELGYLVGAVEGEVMARLPSRGGPGPAFPPRRG
jgi:glycosyltransferase involved in cell wall biosynthesis